ncbi:hypothetical protein LTR97_012248 [Elasticomyces elasticus]|uniref:Scytalone dehydratase-like domain-containing protein n=1 Tax=Elasticomyces elasticus TaxID=574655 RepID=A0AAN7VX29_9PEZI|nr:hypothetical protein LTR97_012248 [Elasticomyces elasticus]
MVRAKQPAADDVIGCQTAMLEWAESYDTKDWVRFVENASPTLYIDYRNFMDTFWGMYCGKFNGIAADRLVEAIPAQEFIDKVADPGFLGNPRVKSSHFVGVSKFDQQDEDFIIGTHQMRVTHQRYKDDALTEVQRAGNGSGNCIVHYRKIDGVWKWAGLMPGIRWKEAEFDKIFYTDD